MSDNNNSAFNPEALEMADFRLVKGSIESPFDFDPEQVDGHKFELGFDLSFNMEDKLTKADFQVQIGTNSKGENIEEAQGSFQFAFIFHVKNLEDLVKQNTDESTQVDGALANALAAISYSTARGILLTRFQGTALRNFILPVINPNDLLYSDDTDSGKG